MDAGAGTAFAGAVFAGAAFIRVTCVGLGRAAVLDACFKILLGAAFTVFAADFAAAVIAFPTFAKTRVSVPFPLVETLVGLGIFTTEDFFMGCPP